MKDPPGLLPSIITKAFPLRKPAERGAPEDEERATVLPVGGEEEPIRSWADLIPTFVREPLNEADAEEPRGLADPRSE